MIFRIAFLWLIKPAVMIAAPLANWEKEEMFVMLGDTFLERDYHEGYLVTALSLATGGKNLRIRNLGWSGDTPRFPSLANQMTDRASYSRVIGKLASAKSHAFADLFSLMKNQDWQTVHGVTFTDDDYRQIAPLFVNNVHAIHELAF